MRVLLVEDDETLISQLTPEIQGLSGADLTIARSRSSAFEQLDEHWFDVVVADLRIPTSDHLMDAEVEHGQAVFARVRQLRPGTPIIVLSAFLDLGIMKDFLDKSEKEDLFGSGTKYLLAGAFEKKKLPDFLRHLRQIASDIRAINDIEIVTREDISREERRVFQLFTRSNGGSLGRLQSVGGGLSDARTFKIVVEDIRGTVKARALAKVAEIPAVDDEHARCARLHSVLPVGSCVSELRVIRAGAGHLAGLFYPYAETHNRTLFHLLGEDPAAAARVIAELRNVEGAWQKNAPSDEMTVQQIRQRSMPDTALDPIRSSLVGLNLEQFEARRVQVQICCQHGDLHGANVLVSDSGAPLLIDYGDVADATTALDPITLELSTVFHPDAEQIRGDWPSVEAASKWADVDEYTKGCPFSDFIKACRSWALAVSRGPREVAATAYGVAIRQMKYEDAPQPLARAIAASAIESFGR
ncbi:MAG TPA: response regulator [Planctomycetota bacterium]|nr:response regulator [Planctomycetota bacterium]